MTTVCLITKARAAAAAMHPVATITVATCFFFSLFDAIE